MLRLEMPLPDKHQVELETVLLVDAAVTGMTLVDALGNVRAERGLIVFVKNTSKTDLVPVRRDGLPHEVRQGLADFHVAVW